MTFGASVRAVARWSAAGVGAAAIVYAGCALATWSRYGRVAAAAPEQADRLLDRFMPRYDVVERHHVRIAAPAAVAFAAARETNVMQSPPIRAIFRARELALRSRQTPHAPAGGLLQSMESLGWRVLAEVPDHEVVVGAATRPWEPDVTFRPIASAAFAAFADPGYVKIAWTLRVDRISDDECIFRTETRVVTTDAEARTRFRRYWAMFSPGIVAIRWLLLVPVKREAERRANEASWR